MAVCAKKEGSRVYVVGDSYAIRSQLKSAGCHWDADRRQWWIGAAKAAAIEQVLGAAKPEAENLQAAKVRGKCEYKGRRYYVIAMGASRWRLASCDGSMAFWAAAELCQWLRDYDWQPSIRELMRYAARAKRADSEIKQGRVPDGYAIDLEDGCVKRISECDMPDRG